MPGAVDPQHGRLEAGIVAPVSGRQISGAENPNQIRERTRSRAKRGSTFRSKRTLLPCRRPEA